MTHRGETERDRSPRIAYLSYSSGEYDARTFRMAKSALAAGYHVTVYCRWHPGLAPVEEREGYRLVRVPFDWRLAIPGLRGGARRQARRAMAEAAAHPVSASTESLETEDGAGDGTLDTSIDEPETEDTSASRDALAALARLPRRLAGKVKRRILRPLRRWRRLLLIFPIRPLGWASALEEVVEPADIWHGMWAGSLPALERVRRRHGGRTIYDSRDVYMQSRDFANAGRPGKTLLEWFERRWAKAADRVITVNESYAGLLVGQLRVARPPVVMNCPETWRPPEPRPDLIREALGLGPETMIALYQGHLMSERGIEPSMEAILSIPNAVLGLLGFGSWLDKLTEQTSKPPYLGRVMLLPPVPPTELLRWTASADVAVMAIAPTTVNHRYTTPQKLFESLAAGVPVVASDLPGMAEVVRETGAGILCDPTSPTAIATAIRAIVDAPPDEREAMRAKALRAAHDKYNWEAQLQALFDVYRALLPTDARPERRLEDPAPVAVR